MADVKNYGIKGVGDDVQLGKRNPRLKVSGTKVQVRNATDTDFTQLQAEDPLVAEDVATKGYVDSVATQDVLYRQATVNFDSVSPVNIGAVLPATAKVQEVKVQITTPWDSLLTTLVIDNTATTFMSAAENDLAEAGTYQSDNPGNTAVGANTQLRAVLTGGSPTQGSALVFVAYTRG